jgi:hypothetical protein
MSRLSIPVAGLVAGLGLGLVGVTGCGADCRESDGPRQESPDGRRTVLSVHKSCGGAAGAEEDLVYVVSGDGEQELGLRIHHQIGPLSFTWVDAGHVEVALSQDATLVESDSPAAEVELTVTRP